ncbi:RING-type E3 ubiquitin transferase [Sarracenia purpurea var. burkii]
MSSLSHFLSYLYTMSMVFFTILFLELVFLVRLISGAVFNSGDRSITAARFVELIEEKNPASRYRIGLRAEQFECAVCLSRLEEGEEIRRLRCDHTFHKACLDTWLQQDWNTCPLCRTKVLPEEIFVRFRRRRGDVEYDGSDEELIFLLSAFHGNNFQRLL